MADRGLAAALAGAARGLRGTQERRRERRQELTDQAEAQRRLLERIALEAGLRQQILQSASQSRGQQEIARERRAREDELRTAIGAARGQGVRVPDIARRTRGADASELIGGLEAARKIVEAARAERGGMGKDIRKPEKTRLSPGQVLIDENGNVIAANPREGTRSDAVPSLGQFLRIVAEKQQDEIFTEGLSADEAIREAARELFGVDPLDPSSPVKFRGAVDLYHKLIDMFEVASTFRTPGSDDLGLEPTE